MKRSVLLTVLLTGCFVRGECQQKKLDSLLAISNAYHHEDSLKVVHLRTVARAYSGMRNYPKFRTYADSAVSIAAKFPNKSMLANMYVRMGSAYHIIDRLQAITLYRKAIETAKMAGATAIEAGACLNLGALYQSIQDYSASLDANERALSLYVSLNDIEDMSSCYLNLANIYNGLHQPVKAVEYTRKALAIFESGTGQRAMGVGYDVLGSTYLAASDKELVEMGLSPADRFKVSSDIFAKGLKAAILSEDKGLIASLYSDFGRLNDMMNKKESALQYFLMAQDLSRNDQSDIEAYTDNLATTGIFYLKKMKDFEKAKDNLFEALRVSKKIGRLNTRQDAYNALSDMHEEQKNYDSALFYYRLVILMRDSITDQEKEKELTRKQLKLDFDIKERDYKQAQQLSDARLKQQLLVARQQEQEILLRRQQLELSNKEKSLQRLTFLQKQADLENQKKAQATLLSQEQMKAGFDKKTSDQQINVQNIQLVSNKRLSVFLAVVAVIVCVASMVISNSRHKTMKLNRLVSEQKAALEELVDVKDKIFSIVSHDMRGPMNNLAAFSSLLAEGYIEQDKLTLYLEQIKGTLDHTSSLMENLLNWSASQMKGFTPVIENVDISSVVRHTLRGMEQPLMRKKIRVVNQVAAGTYVKGDRNMIELIIRNLVSNAIKFSRTDGLLDLYAMHNEKEVVLSVKDNGVGMAESKVQKINSASVHSLESTYGTEKEKGTGLGLMLCKHFAGIMGGSITVSSHPGGGSQFHISLPAAA